MKEKRTDLLRVHYRDKETINRIAGALKVRTGRPVTAGDVVADAVNALLVQQPDLASAVAAQPTVQP